MLKQGVFPEDKIAEVMTLAKRCLEINSERLELKEQQEQDREDRITNEILDMYSSNNKTPTASPERRINTLRRIIYSNSKRKLLNWQFRRRRKRDADSPQIIKRPGIHRMTKNLVIPGHWTVKIDGTRLRNNIYYYRIYYVGLNTLFAAILPLLLLLFLNARTAAELFKMGRAEAERSPITIGQRKLVVRYRNASLFGFAYTM